MASPKLFFITFLLIFATVKGSGFDYDKQAKWLDDYPDCSLNRQSPIEIISDEALFTYDVPAIKFSNYDTIFTSVVIQNNGHTANIAIPASANPPQISNGPYEGAAYVAEGVHFHWGSRSTHGSEHVIDSKRFSMEMHIVHRNSKYATIDDAKAFSDGLAVLAVMFEVEANKADFPGLDGVVSSLPSITAYDEETEIENFSLQELIQTLDTSMFYTYQGSLTTPPCSQAVTWVVFGNSVPITQAQFEKYHLLVEPNGEVMENNYRELQPKGDRKVTYAKCAARGV